MKRIAFIISLSVVFASCESTVQEDSSFDDGFVSSSSTSATSSSTTSSTATSSTSTSSSTTSSSTSSTSSSTSSTSSSSSGGDGICSNSADTDCIQIATFNAGCLTNTDGVFCNDYGSASSNTKKQAIADIITDNGFDLIVLEEVDNDDVIDDIVTLAGGTSVWSTSMSSTYSDQRIVFMYNKNLMSLSSISELTASPFDSTDWSSVRRPYYAEVNITSTSKTFKVVGLHLKAGSASDSCTKREGQVDDLDSWLSGISGDVILIGDMNDEISGYGICSSTDTFAGLEDNTGSFQFITTSANGMGSSGRVTNLPYSSVIDHIYMNDAFVSDLEYINGTSQVVEVVQHGDEDISDHQPVYIWLKAN